MKINIYTDGGCYNNGTSNQDASICVFHDDKKIYHESIGNHTSNEAEFIAISRAFDYINTLAGRKTSTDQVIIHSDSKLAVNMLNKVWKGKLERIKNLRDEVLKKKPKGVLIKWIPREQNNAGNYLEFGKGKPEPIKDNLVGLVEIIEEESKKTDISQAIEFLRKFQWSSIVDGWKTREHHLVAVGVNQTIWTPDPISFTDLEEYDKMSPEDIFEVLNGVKL